MAYVRVPRIGACPFCLMLASRGAVYKRGTVEVTKSGRKYHDNCHCMPREVLPGDDLPLINQALQAKWEGMGSSVIDDWEELTYSARLKAWAGSRAGREIETGRALIFDGAKEHVQRYTSLGQVSRKRKKKIRKTAISWANPGYLATAGTETHADYRVNCVRVVNAYLMRRAGFDISAGPGRYSPRTKRRYRSALEASLNTWVSPTGKAPTFLWSAEEAGGAKLDEVLASIRESTGSGAYGVLRYGSGIKGYPHALIWENRAGEIVLADPQTLVDDAYWVTRNTSKPGTFGWADLTGYFPTDATLTVVGY